ncbi:putative ABC transport system permease protein [Litorimonas taeanensis]|uniref:Putative ABC transport system permease protein n=1 Tax=Litorimonas taeanensis TaxID=568099 RepID=A0A420WDQ1_9PROT|nr:ABC transporter permease [Litorimonas taeanensis]RKQ69123.1 putative ABC transport system permease protein [Litorimonas taeanensis]
MKYGVALRSAIEALRSNPMRSFLTMLGIMIGVASVMAMMAISEGAARQVDEQISSLGANNLTVRPGADRRGGRSSGAGSATPFTDSDLEALRSEPYALAVTGRINGSGTVVAGETNWTTSIYGVNADFFISQDWQAQEGRVLEDIDVTTGAAVAVIGSTIADTLFEGSSAMGQRIRVNNVPLTVIGILDTKGQSNFGSDRDDVVVIPIKTARNRVLGGHSTTPNYVSSIELSVTSGYDMTRAQDELEERLRTLRRIRPGATDDFRVFNIADFIRARSSTQATFGILLAFTAAVSLIVGGVGVMNIMLVSVTERTREIGLRMAIGARGQDILGQFLFEAIGLCLLGGIMGSGLGVGAAELAAKLGDFPVKISPFIAVIAIGSAVVVGLFFGFFPARRAAKLNPIEALRHD